LAILFRTPKTISCCLLNGIRRSLLQGVIFVSPNEFVLNGGIYNGLRRSMS
jgi:hypothetical protein